MVIRTSFAMILSRFNKKWCMPVLDQRAYFLDLVRARPARKMVAQTRAKKLLGRAGTLTLCRERLCMCGVIGQCLKLSPLIDISLENWIVRKETDRLQASSNSLKHNLKKKTKISYSWKFTTGLAQLVFFFQYLFITCFSCMVLNSLIFF